MDIEFINGLLVKQPHENAPDFVKGSISIKREDLIEWLSKMNDEWINADIKESQKGGWYVSVNNWKTDKSQSPPADDMEEEDIPF